MSHGIRITLIHPPKPKSLRKKSRQWVRPLGLHYLAAMLKKHDFKVTILDFEKDLVDESQRVAILKDSPSELFGITSVTYTRFQAIDIARDIKTIYPKSVVMVGGVHFRFVAEETLHHVKEIDIVCIKEGENVILDVARAIASGKRVEEMDDVPGIVFRKDGQIVRTNRGPIIKNLDEIPFYTDFTWEDYPEYVTVAGEEFPACTVITSRGCPYRCAFCSMGDSVYRHRSPGHVVDEMEYFIDRFGIQAFHFFDSTLAANPKHCGSIAKEIINRGLTIKWSCGLRADTSLDLLPLMKEAGLVSFTLGVEAGSPRILNSLRKGITLEQVESIIERADQLNIEVSAFFMLSHPDETFEDALQTVLFRRRIWKHSNVHPMPFTVTMVFPGTEVERMAKDRGILPQNFSWSLPYESEVSNRFAMSENIPIYLENMTPEEIERILTIDSSFYKLKYLLDSKSDSLTIRKWARIIFARRGFRRWFRFVFNYLLYLKYHIRDKLGSTRHVN